jgi:hypothetical protein
MLHVIGANLSDLLEGTASEVAGPDFERQIYAEKSGNDLVVHFKYADSDAQYVLPNATSDQFEFVVKTLRDGLSRLAAPDAIMAEAIKTDAVASAFLAATRTWPQTSPSDLWWFVIYRAYCDPYNHPGQFARLEFAQSWKRTGGWALEEVLVRHYGPYLASKGVRLFIASSGEKESLLRTVKVRDRLEADKVDVVLTTTTSAGEKLLGVVHVKASIAERRTDDVPMSRTLIKAGCLSPLWTMDCKSTPSERPMNRGELGELLRRGADERSAKRKDIEKDGYFSACFSYNTNTIPTARNQKAKARIHVCDFRNPNDAFSRFILEGRRNPPSL